MELERETFLGVGLILFVAGFMIFLAYNPLFTSLSARIAGYETGEEPIKKADYEYFILLSTLVMPLVNTLIAIGVTLLLLGAFAREKKE